MEPLLLFLTTPILGTATWLWLSFLGIVIALLVLDLGILHRDQHEIEMRESLLLYSGYFSVGVLFGLWIWHELGVHKALEFYTGFLVEQSLSGRLRLREEIRKLKREPARLRAVTVPPRVVIDNHASNTFTVIEVNGRDRPGLLHDVTAAISDQGLQIASAHITAVRRSRARLASRWRAAAYASVSM